MKKYAILTLSLVLFIFSSCFSQSFNEQLYKFGRVLNLVNTLYVDSVQEEKLVEHAIIEMLHELDPHSIYISKEEVAAMNEPLEGSFEGIGIQFRLMEDTLLVVGVISSGPSEKVGLKNGDRIISVDGESIAGIGIKNQDILKMLRGDKGTLVNVEVVRRGVKKPIDFTITRDKIPIYSVDAGFITDDGFGYIKLNRFARTTMEELSAVFDEFKDNSVKDIILDLSDNSGGYLDQAIDLADEFLEKNQLVVYTEGRSNPRKDYKATTKGRYEKGRLIIIVDEGSASASEIVAGAIQDWDRGAVIGRRTFGKGLVQRPFSLTDGSMIRLTVARYYTPTGRLIQKPYEEGYEEYAKDVYTRFNHGELLHEDSIKLPDSLSFETLINKRNVYGGGGIMPDYFIPLDTNRYSAYHYELLRKGVLFRFIGKYVDDNRENMTKSYPDINTFKKKFECNDDIIYELDTYAAENKVYRDSFDVVSPELEYLLKTHIKSLIAGDIWRTNEFYQIFNDINPYYIEARKILLDNKKYNELLNKK